MSRPLASPVRFRSGDQACWRHKNGLDMDCDSSSAMLEAKLKAETAVQAHDQRFVP